MMVQVIDPVGHKVARGIPLKGMIEDRNRGRTPHRSGAEQVPQQFGLFAIKAQNRLAPLLELLTIAVQPSELLVSVRAVGVGLRFDQLASSQPEIAQQLGDHRARHGQSQVVELANQLGHRHMGVEQIGFGRISRRVMLQQVLELGL